MISLELKDRDSNMLLTLALAAQVACTPTDVSEDEAEKLVVVASHEIAPRVEIGLIAMPRLAGQTTWAFRAFAIHPRKGDVSDLMGWYSVGKRTADLGDPVSGRRLSIPVVQREQERLRAIHCLSRRDAR
jgi:hypothetical protein